MLQTGFIFSCSILINYILSYLYQYLFLSVPFIEWNFYSSHIVQVFISIVSILIPAIFFGRAFGFNFKKSFKTSPLNIAVAAVLGVVAVPLVTQLNNLFIYLIQPILSNPEVPVSDTPSSISGLLFLTLTSSLYVAFAEELFFRGVLVKPLHKTLSPLWIILFGSFLFAVAHFSLKALVSSFVMGVIFATLAWYTKSLIPSMVTHFVYNTSVLIVNYFSVYWIQVTDASDWNGILKLILKLISCACLILVLIYRIQKTNKLENSIDDNENLPKFRMMDFISFLPGAFLLLMTFLQELSFI